MATNRHKTMVHEFHSIYGLPIAHNSNVGTVEYRQLRARLILEEAIEFALAAGLDIWCTDTKFITHIDDLTIVESKNRPIPNLIEMADGLGDLDYVVQGANLVFGLPSEDIFTEIHRSNMSKLDDNGNPIIRVDGKILKGPNYFKPRIAKILGLPEPEQGK